MKNLIFLITTLFSLSATTAQILDFTLADPQPDLLDVYGGSFASGDIDGDGDQDLLMNGLTPGRNTAMYLNDGLGNFTEVVTIPFPEAADGIIILEDLDSDGDLDVYMSGQTPNTTKFAHIYLNDGLGTFTQLANPALPGFVGGGVDIDDADDDGDLDLLISCKDGNDVFITDIYLNDGNAVFTPSGSTAFNSIEFGAVAFVDVENDGDPDVIISGEQSNGMAETSLYLNDGLGNYSVDPSTSLVQLKAADIDVADTDNDGDLDILTSGTTDALDVQTILYVNDGTGQFTEVTTGIQDTFAGTNAIADLDNDGDQDIVIIGSQDGGLPNIYNKVYQNMGNNEFTEVDTIGGEYLAACVVDDFNGDDLLDIIIQGFVEDTNVYWNTSTILSTADEIFPSQSVSIYPNPSNGILNLVSNNTVIQNVSMYNAIGVLVDTKEFNGTTTEYQMEINQATGVYFMLITTDKATETYKLILN